MRRFEHKLDWRTLTSPSVPELVVKTHPLLWNGTMLPVGAVFPTEDNLRRARQLYEQNKIEAVAVIETVVLPKKHKRGK